jgi:toxin ParE1/3/4
MRARITKSVRARRDLLEHFVYIGRDSVPAARRFLKAADKAMASLARMPQMGGRWASRNPALRELRVWSIRKFENYLIFYRPTPEGIEVLRVLHGARDIDTLLEGTSPEP